MLKNVSEVILVTKNIFFLKIVNFVQSFVECKVSLADGTLVLTATEQHLSAMIKLNPNHICCFKLNLHAFVDYRWIYSR